MGFVLLVMGINMLDVSVAVRDGGRDVECNLNGTAPYEALETRCGPVC